MAELADFIARHALLVLAVVVALSVLVTALFWHIVRMHGMRLWDIALRLWNFLGVGALAARSTKVPIIGPVLNRTLTVVRYFGLYAVLAFVAATAALSVFFELVDEIGLDESLAEFDVQLARALARHVSRDVLNVFAVLTHLGDPKFLIALGALVTVTLLALKRWILAAAWTITTLGGGAINVVLKKLFERQRPLHEPGLVAETSWSFPSGHASGSMLVYGLLGYLLVRHTRREWHIPIVIGMVALIVFVGSSRVLLQVHYLSDVLAGYASAAVWSALCVAGLETVRRRDASITNRRPREGGDPSETSN